jgi:hypothetical protein
MIHAGLPRPRGHQPLALVHSHNPIESCVILEKAQRSGPESSIERIDNLIRLAAQSIKQLSKTGAKLEDIVMWVTECLPAPETMLTFVNNLPVDVLRTISLGVLHYAETRTREPLQVDHPAG